MEELRWCDAPKASLYCKSELVTFGDAKYNRGLQDGVHLVFLPSIPLFYI